MKTIISFLALIILFSCTMEKQELETKQTTIKVLPNEVNKNTLEFRFLRDEKGYLDFTKIEVVNSSSNRTDTWTHCGGGVFTNGNGQTYMYIAREEGFPGAIRAFDDFIQEPYYYTVHWCSCTCTNLNKKIYYLNVKNNVYLNDKEFKLVLDEFEISEGILITDKTTIEKFQNLLLYGTDCESCKDDGCEYVSTTTELSTLSVVVTVICESGFYSVSYSPITGSIRVKYLGMP